MPNRGPLTCCYVHPLLVRMGVLRYLHQNLSIPRRRRWNVESELHDGLKGNFSGWNWLSSLRVYSKAASISQLAFSRILQRLTIPIEISNKPKSMLNGGRFTVR